MYIQYGKVVFCVDCYIYYPRNSCFCSHYLYTLCFCFIAVVQNICLEVKEGEKKYIYIFFAMLIQSPPPGGGIKEAKARRSKPSRCKQKLGNPPKGGCNEHPFNEIAPSPPK